MKKFILFLILLPFLSYGQYSLNLPGGIRTLNDKPADAKYWNLSTGLPYANTAAVLSALPSGIRGLGLTVNVNGVEYCFCDGITDGDLRVKFVSSVAGSDTQIQVNNSGAFGASSNLSYNASTNTFRAATGLTISGTGSMTDNFYLGADHSNTTPGGNSSKWNMLIGENLQINNSNSLAAPVNDCFLLGGFYNKLNITSTSTAGLQNTGIIGSYNSIIESDILTFPGGYNGDIMGAIILGGQKNKISPSYSNGTSDAIAGNWILGGGRNISDGHGSGAFGYWSQSSGAHSIVHGYVTTFFGGRQHAPDATFDPDGGSSLSHTGTVPRILASGKHAINMSANSPEQVSGHGVTGDYAAAFAGRNHHVTGVGSVAIGGYAQTVTDSATVAVSNLQISTKPIVNDTITHLLVIDNATGKVKRRNVSSLGGNFWKTSGTTSISNKIDVVSSDKQMTIGLNNPPDLIGNNQGLKLHNTNPKFANSLYNRSDSLTLGSDYLLHSIEADHHDGVGLGSHSISSIFSDVNGYSFGSTNTDSISGVSKTVGLSIYRGSGINMNDDYGIGASMTGDDGAGNLYNIISSPSTGVQLFAKSANSISEYGTNGLGTIRWRGVFDTGIPVSSKTVDYYFSGGSVTYNFKDNAGTTFNNGWSQTASGFTLGAGTSSSFLAGIQFSTTGTITLTLPSSATGDTYYRNASGNLVRQAIGTSRQIQKVVSGVPVWSNASNASTSGTTTGTFTTTLTDINCFKITPAGNCTFNASGGDAGQRCTFVITTSGTTSYTLTFGTNYKTIGTLATGIVSAKVFTIDFVYDGTNWNEVARTIAM